jgi:DNA-binding transcriptional LysR family regulator
MEFRYLNAFILTARYRSFSKAAQQLKIAQSAVSRQIQLLEQSVGCQLLLRSPAGVELTPKGHELLIRGSAFRDWADEFSKKSLPPVRIAALEGLAATWLPSILCQASLSDISIEIKIASADLIKTMFEKAQIDLALLPVNIDSALVTSRRLFKEELIGITKEKASKQDLKRMPWVYYEQAAHLRALFKTSPERQIRAGSLQGLMEFVRRGCGLGIIPRHSLPAGARLHIHELEELREQWIYLASLNYDLEPTAVSRIRKALIDASKI